MGFRKSEIWEREILGKWDFGNLVKQDCGEVGFYEVEFLKSDILGNWVWEKLGFWNSETLGKVDFG